jgi:hypothetical protein
MSSRTSILRLASVAAAAVACVAVALAASESPRDSVADSLQPTPVFASIERAWVLGNADAVLESFGKRKVFISLPDGGPEGGLYSRAQSYFILKDFFDVTRTEEFSFVSIHEPEDQPHTAIGRAERTFRLRDSSRLQQDRIFVSLVQESDRWVVAEIKALR